MSCIRSACVVVLRAVSEILQTKQQDDQNQDWDAGTADGAPRLVT